MRKRTIHYRGVLLVCHSRTADAGRFPVQPPESRAIKKLSGGPLHRQIDRSFLPPRLAAGTLGFAVD